MMGQELLKLCPLSNQFNHSRNPRAIITLIIQRIQLTWMCTSPHLSSIIASNPDKEHLGVKIARIRASSLMEKVELIFLSTTCQSTAQVQADLPKAVQSMLKCQSHPPTSWRKVRTLRDLWDLLKQAISPTEAQLNTTKNTWHQARLSSNSSF